MVRRGERSHVPQADILPAGGLQQSRRSSEAAYLGGGYTFGGFVEHNTLHRVSHVAAIKHVGDIR
jgi:hypothetical protein